MRYLVPLTMLLVLGCQPQDENPPATGSDQFALQDGDGDGYSPAMGDCDDTNPYVNPGAQEFCDGIDNDCDTEIDDADASAIGLIWMFDGDSDLYGLASDDGSGQYIVACDVDTFEELVENTGGDPSLLAFYVPAQYDASGNILVDCNDENATVNPGAPEICDALDNDCDSVVDDGVPTPSSFYLDWDGDTYGDSAVSVEACSAPTGFVADNTDCDDNNGDINPSAQEVCDSADTDEDCDLASDDTDPSVDPATMADWFLDGDGDGFGQVYISTSCDTVSSALVTDSTDCNDSNVSVNPAATEVCNGIDDDCDTVVDPPSSSGAPTWYADSDADAFGNPSSSTVACSQPTGYVADATDCDDGNASINPGAQEACDPGNVDEDCDSLADDADASVDPASQSTWYQDSDVDGFGNASASAQACDQPSGYVADATDCDDTSAGNYPGAPETCDTIDNDCDGTADNGVESPFYQDGDTDGFGNAVVVDMACVPPSGYVANSTDCNDADASAYPGAPEECDGVDDDCDGSVDENAIDQTTWSRDFDGDAYGNSSITNTSCAAPPGFVEAGGDCNDGNPSVNPGATEVFNGVDDDCDGLVDENVSCTTQVIIFDDVGEAVEITGVVSDDPSLSGEWFPGGVSGVSVSPISLGGNDWEYDISMDLCLSASGSVIVDGEFEDASSICDDATSTVYGSMDTTPLSVLFYDNGDGTCSYELMLP